MSTETVEMKGAAPTAEERAVRIYKTWFRPTDYLRYP